MCDAAVEENPWCLEDVPDHLKTQEMSKRVVEENPWWLKDVPDHLRTKEMCKKAVKEKPYTLKYVPDPLKTQEMCDKAVRDHCFSLQYVPDWFVRLQQIGPWDDDDDDVDEIIEWYDGHKKRKAQNAQIKEELMPIVWNPSRWGNWCVLKTRKKRQKNCGSRPSDMLSLKLYNKRRCLNLVR